MIGYIYKITNLHGKIYVGQTDNLERRKKEYLNPNRIKGQRLIYNSINKYGWQTHIFEIIEEIDMVSNPLLLEELEIHWIKELKLNRNKFPE